MTYILTTLKGGYAYTTARQVLGDDSELVSLARQSADANNAIDQRKLSYLTNKKFRKEVPAFESFFSDGYSGASPAPASSSPLYDAHFFTIFSVVMHPFARGSVHINASAPTGKPVIDPKYASNPYDLKAIVEAAKLNRRIAEAPSLRYSWTDEYDPGLSVTTDAEWENWVRNNTLSIYHPLGSCAMLPQDKGGVVDSNLVVYGAQNLRIVDASVIPVLPSGHLQTMVYGIAERGADILVAQYSKQT